ncbi:MAG: Lrp/AsnC family transcriptional regulator [Nitrososphaerota archaeon]|nr:Lrp/AsnC family transcriptional regulator [Nitrososphaerota archaeon]
MDALDLQILETLRQNSRSSLTEISKVVGISDVTAHTRIKSMVESGVIRGFTTIIDYEQLGYSVTAFVKLSTTPGSKDAIGKALESIPWVVEIHEISSNFDFLLKIKATNLGDLRSKIVSELSRIEGVLGVDVTPILNVRKESSMPLASFRAVRGESGVIHEFAEVASDSDGIGSLVEKYNSEVTGREVLITYVKASDVKANRTEIVAPAYTKEAEELARAYNIELKSDRDKLQ